MTIMVEGVANISNFIIQKPNNPPVWQTNNSLGVWWDYEIIDVTILATDLDQDTVVYSTSDTLPGTCTLNSSTGRIYGSAGDITSDTTYSFTITASDGITSIPQLFTITVKNNLAPTWITPSGSLGTTYEGNNINYQVVATDLSDPTLTYTLTSGTLPTGSTLNASSGIISGPPVSVSSNTTYTFTISVSDGYLSSSRTFSINITNNIQPVWTTTAGSLGTFNGNASINTNIIANDADGLPQPLTYSIVAGELPSGVILSYSNGVGIIYGTIPSLGTTTTYIFTIRATDGLDYADRQFSIMVNGSSYVVSNSLKLDGTNKYFTRTFAAGNRKTWTFSVWVKRSKLGSIQEIFSTTDGAGQEGRFRFTAADQIEMLNDGMFSTNLTTLAVFRDPAAWMHLQLVADATNTTQSDRWRLYVNGIRQTLSHSSFNNADGYFNGAYIHSISRSQRYATYFYDGYFAQPIFIDNAALETSYFGEFDSTTGSWRPKDLTAVSDLERSTVNDTNIHGSVTTVDRSWSLNSGSTVDAIDLYSTSSSTGTLKILRRDSTGQYTQIQGINYIHLGTGWERFPLNTTYNVPATGEYFIGVYQNNSVTGGVASGAAVSYASGDQQGTFSLTETTNSHIPAAGATYKINTNIAPNGTAIASGGSPNPMFAITNINNSTSSINNYNGENRIGYDTNSWCTESTTGWVGVDFGLNKTVRAYGIKPNAHDQLWPGGNEGFSNNLSSWTFEGWNGSSWVVLDTQSKSGVYWRIGVIYYFMVKNPSSYTKYRINGTSCGGYICIAELLLFETFAAPFGVNGSKLLLDNTANFGQDTSGNNNNFTSYNITSSDASQDTPTNNFCTLSTVDKHPNQPLSNGNLTLTNNGWDNSYKAGGTFSFDSLDTSGYYFEVKMNTHSDNNTIGFCKSTINLINNTEYAYQSTAGFWGLSDSGPGGGNRWYIINNTGSTPDTSVGWTTGDVIGIFVRGGKWWAHRNGTWFLSGNPNTNTNPIGYGLAGFMKPYGSASQGQYTFNFGQSSFAYTPPTGYRKLCTNNLPYQTNYTTLNPLDKNNSIVLSNNNLTASGTGVNQLEKVGATSFITSTMPIYFEVRADALFNNMEVGAFNAINIASIGSHTQDQDVSPIYSNFWYMCKRGPGGNYMWEYRHNTTITSTGVVGAIGDIIRIAISNGKIWFAVNGGNWIGGGNPVLGTSPTASDLPSVVGIWCGMGSGGQFTFNFGQSSFMYSPPDGFTNQPSQFISSPSSYFRTITDTGVNIKTSTSALYTNYLSVIKDRVNASNWQWIDSVRGSSLVLQSNTYSADTSYVVPSGNCVGYVWKAGNSVVSNTNGSIASQVCANTISGFSIVTYSTTTQAAGTVGHGLNATPAFIILKSRTNSSNLWYVWHKSVSGTDGNMNLNEPNSLSTNANLWNNGHTSSIFGVGNYVGFTGAGNFVAYCWSEVEGFSKFGSYTGNGNADGPFIYCGFKPRWIMVKRTDAAMTQLMSWRIIDAARFPYNLPNGILGAETSSAEVGSSQSWDLVSNGFKCRSPDPDTNSNGGIYIFAAFAENPLGNEMTTEATSR